MTYLLQPRIEGEIRADDLTIGKGVVVERGVLITGKEGRARKVVLGDFSYIGRETRIIAPEFRLGDYSKLHSYSFAHGKRPLQIGRNCWIGGNTVLDSLGGLDIADNVGIGAHSQVWTHIQFGDIVEGSRFHSTKYMYIGHDAWFVGHCIVSPVRVGEKSMALAGSVITKDMFPNHIYGGVPAKDLTEKMGPQFETRTVDQKAIRLQQLIDRFLTDYPQYEGQLWVVKSWEEALPDVTSFNVSERTYAKTYSEAEVLFLRLHVPLVKFAPAFEPDFIIPQQPVEPFSERA